jgi:hypothetical protein
MWGIQSVGTGADISDNDINGALGVLRGVLSSLLAKNEAQASSEDRCGRVAGSAICSADNVVTRRRGIVISPQYP